MIIEAARLSPPPRRDDRFTAATTPLLTPMQKLISRPLMIGMTVHGRASPMTSATGTPL